MKNKRVILILVGIVILIAAGIFFWTRRNSTTNATSYTTVKAERGTLTATIGATGTVRAKQSAILTWQTSGIVDLVNVNIGDTVSADQVLASLRQTSLSTSIILAEADLVTAQKTLDDLLSSNTSSAQAEQAAADAQKAVEDAQKKVDSLTFPRASDTLIEKTQAQIDLAKKKVALMADIYKRYARRLDGDPDKAQALLNLTNAQIELNNLIAQLNWYVGQVTPTEADQYRANLVVAQAQLADAQRELEQLKNGPSNGDIVTAKAKIAAAQATLNQAKITAPFSGTITKAEPQPGDKVSANQDAFRIDNLSSLLVDLQVSEVDINTVEVGQPVTITFDAIQNKTYNGKVYKISGAGDSTSNGVNFTVTVELTEFDEAVKPGMTASVTITVRELKDVLLIPSRAVRQLDNKRVVYVLKDGQAVPVEVRLGGSSGSMSEVVGGDLQEGDLVIMNPPTSSQNQNSPGAGPMMRFGG